MAPRKCNAGSSRSGTSPTSTDFWENADQQAYFDLYASSARTIEVIDPKLRVGGRPPPAPTGVPLELLAFAAANNVPIDFVTTHTYGVAGGFLDEEGKHDTKLLSTPDAIVADVRRVRSRSTASPFPELPLYFTEWSSSYTRATSSTTATSTHSSHPEQAQSKSKAWYRG